MMRAEDGPDTSPDSFTYAGLVQALSAARRWDLLNDILRQMQRDKVVAHPELWSLIIITAGRAERPQLALEMYEAMVEGGSARTQQVYNALMASQARAGQLDKVLELYRAMVADGLAPDEYTFTAVLTAMSHAGASVFAVEDLVAEMAKWGIKVCATGGATWLGCFVWTCVLSACRHSHALSCMHEGRMRP